MSAPYYQDDSVTLHHGDCLDVLACLPDNSVDAVVTDPPYGLEFMGREWDSFKPSDARIRTRVDERTNGATKSTVSVPEAYRAGQPFQRWCNQWATECLRILKPGGHLLAFGGSRTWHRLSSGIEDAGFEIRDSIAWLYGSGFPKSMDVSKAIDKAAGVEREVIGQRRKLDSYGAQAGNAVYGGGPNHDGVQTITAPATEAAKRWQGWGTALKPAFEPIVVARKPLAGTVAANVLEHGTGALNIDACRVTTTDDLNGGAYAKTGRRSVSGSLSPTGMNVPGKVVGKEFEPPSGRWPTNVILDERQAEVLDRQTGVLHSGTMHAGTERQPRAGGTIYGADARTFTPADTYGDSGGASRFFPVFRYEAKAPSSERPNADGVEHPTVKPLDLMRWLVRLVTPVGAMVLEPFAGSGTTAEACVLEDRQCIAIEREAEYLPLIVSRLRKPLQQGLFGLEAGA
ncbi:DNA-methyltransferase [Mycobacteroides abscessus]|uniref:DNA-methyltransferase n=1 Tax=Mycobacteroides abscessus TaxID=36809 RepID=UPI000D6A0D0C|nr:DNA methyltransferase [Mycobacteroides abscessus]